MTVREFIFYFISLLVICSPFSAVPALLRLSHGLSDEEKKRTGSVAGVAVGIILVVMTWIGSPLLNILGISVPAFQVAGGFVIFLLALSMLNAQTSRIKQTAEDQKETAHRESIAIVPLAIPIMAGPGAISTVVVAANDYPGILNKIFLSVGAILVALVLGITLNFSIRFERMLGQSGINIVNRLAGLILAGMSVQTISKGLLGLFPVLGVHG